MTPLELLAPARDLMCGKAAIDCGADAVYIGASRFGARASAGNTVEDIAELCAYAHRWGAKVYATINTLVRPEEYSDVEQLINQLDDAGVDAVLVQDMKVAAMVRRSGMALHASTQTDNRTARKVMWLASQGFERTVLARELSVSEIAEIHRAVPSMPLEVFVHGALCVSYSGLCYASERCFGRSANRGECAQFCRLKFNLVDADDRIIEHERYLLSLKDMNQSANVGRLIEAGAVSFKIEGRLKDAAYVKNVVSAYSRLLDQYITSHSADYCRASLGRCTYSFEPNLRKTFNRGFTTYFADGRRSDISSPDTPKAIGEHVGRVKELRGASFTVAGTASFANGDGLCFINSERRLEGFRVNRAEGGRLFPLKMPSTLRPGMALYRNNDKAFEDILAHSVAERRIPIRFELSAVEGGFRLNAQIKADGCGIDTHESNPPYLREGITLFFPFDHQPAKRPPHESITANLSKLGGTIFACQQVCIPDDFNLFLPASLLGEMRRRAVEVLTNEISEWNIQERSHRKKSSMHRMSATTDAPVEKRFGDASQPWLEAPSDELPLMQCRYCLRYALGHCVKHGGSLPPWREPLYLALPDGKRFRLEFDCRRCQMNVLAT